MDYDSHSGKMLTQVKYPVLFDFLDVIQDMMDELVGIKELDRPEPGLVFVLLMFGNRRSQMSTKKL
jgi:hypothetical protein